MSDERTQVALAAGELVTVGEKDYRLRPVSVQALADLQADALRAYKRQYLQTYAENADLLGNGAGIHLIERKMAEAARWSLEDLPQHTAYAVDGIEATDRLKEWAGLDDDAETLLHTLNALDQGDVTPDKIEELTGTRPRSGKVRFDQWWITGDLAGQMAFIASSLRHAEDENGRVTKEELMNWPLGKIAEAARIVERLTTVDLGNT